MPARSDPASGSENPWHQIDSPLRIRGRWNSCCAALPLVISDGPAWLTATQKTPTWGAPASAYCSHQMSCWMSDNPRPPCSTGHDTPAQPPSYWRRCQARSNATIASPVGGRGSPGMLARSQVEA